MKSDQESLSELFHRHARLSLTVLLTFVFIGASALFLMPREEDPRLQNRFGFVSVIFPGASPEVIEQLVVRPIEERLREIESIKKIETTIRPEGAGLSIELKDRVQEINEAWSLVEAALDRERPQMPKGVLELTLDKNSNAVESIVLAIVQNEESAVGLEKSRALQIRRRARELRSEILRQGLAQRVNLYGDPGESLNVVLQESAMRRHGISPLMVAQGLRDASTSAPAGQIRTPLLQLPLLSPAHVNSADDLQTIRIAKPSGASVSLAELGDVSEGVLTPAQQLARWNGQLAVVLGVVPPERIDVVLLGKKLRNFIEQFNQENQVFEVHEVAFSPDRTEARLEGLLNSLLQGILSVGVVLMIWMGWRLGVIVALSVPLITIIGLAIYFIGGGVLHQISLAAFVISLGQFIDNVIVVAESMQRQIDRGIEIHVARRQVVKEFSKPMLFATGTAIACFIPLLASEGGSAEFTFAIPLIAVITLLVSYLIALVVVPLFSTHILRSRRQTEVDTMWESRFARGLTQLILNRPRLILITALCLLVISGFGFVFVKKEFFPSADRNEFVVKLEFPDGQSLESTSQKMKEIELALRAQSGVDSVTSFVGQGTPLFYYNLMPVSGASHIAELIITTDRPSANAEVAEGLRRFVREQIPEARIVVQFLEQGPPIKAPIELRLQGGDQELVRALADRLVEELSRMEGVVDARHDLGLGLVSLRLNSNDTSSTGLNLGRTDLSMGLLSRSNGVEIARVGGQVETRPLRLRVEAQDQETVEGSPDVLRMPILDTEAGVIEVGQIATAKLELTPSVIYRRNGAREVTILAGLAHGASFDQVQATIQEKLSVWIDEARQRTSAKAEAEEGGEQTFQNLSSGLVMSWGGQAEGAGEANLSVFRTIPFGLLLLMGCLLLEFNSFRKILVIFLALPLAIVGVVPGLLIGDQPFGFMSLLGLLSLVGIVVNNAILIMEGLAQEEGEGVSFAEALQRTLAQRTRPILMTASLTIVGLLPLVFEESTLWPPLAWAMMTGLVASTGLTLLVLPTLYAWFFNVRVGDPESPPRKGAQKSILAQASLSVLSALVAVSSVLFVLGWVTAVESRETSHDLKSRPGQVMSLDEIWAAAMLAPGVQADAQAAEVEEGRVEIQKWSINRPRVQIEGTTAWRDRDRFAPAPFGSQAYGQKRDILSGISLQQNLWVAEQHGGGLEAADLRAQSRRAQHQTTRLNVALEVSRLSIEHLRLQQTLNWMASSTENLRTQLEGVRRLTLMSRAGPSDQLRIQVEIGSIEQDRLAILAASDSLRFQIQAYIPAYGSIATRESKTHAEAETKTTTSARSALRSTGRNLLKRIDELKVKSDQLDRVDLNTRSEVMQLSLLEESLRKEAQSHRATWAPNLQLEGRMIYADQGLLETRQWSELSLRAQWPLYEGGARARAVEVSEVGAKAQVNLRESRLRQWQVDREAARLQIEKLVERAKWIEQTEQISERALSLERRRLKEGRLSLERYLDAERAALRVVRQRIDLETEMSLMFVKLRWLAEGSSSPTPNAD